MKDNFIDNLKMNTEQKQSFNFGFVNLSLDDVLILLNIKENEFNEKYKYYYDMGNSFCKFETLKKILDKSSMNIDTLKEYAEYRKIKDSKDLKVPQSEIINTTDLINKLRNSNE